MNPSCFKRFEFFSSCPFSARNNGACVAHALTCWRSDASNIRDHGFCDMCLDKGSGFFFCTAADLPDSSSGTSSPSAEPC